MVDLLTRRLVSVHSWVVGEIACGNHAHRAEVLRYLQRLPKVPTLRDYEVLYFIEQHRLMGSGMGWVDSHLVAAAIASGASFWTRDKRILAAVGPLGVLYSPPMN